MVPGLIKYLSSRRPPPLADAPPELDDLLSRAWAPDPSSRPDAADFSDGLAEALVAVHGPRLASLSLGDERRRARATDFEMGAQGTSLSRSSSRSWSRSSATSGDGLRILRWTAKLLALKPMRNPYSKLFREL